MAHALSDFLDFLQACFKMGGARKGKGGNREAKPASISTREKAMSGDSPSTSSAEIDMAKFAKDCKEAQSFDPGKELQARARDLEKLPACSQRNHAQGRSLLICE